MRKKLPLRFYQRDTVAVSQELLGKQLVHVVKGRRLSGLIVETEAYTGVEDAACHAFGGRRTQRNDALYSLGGHSYVYFIYGMYYCLNVVTQKTDCPEAVLIRAIEPTEGLDIMLRNRNRRAKVKKQKDLTNGPGKLCDALQINRLQNGLKLNSDQLYIEDVGVKVASRQIAKVARIGVSYAGEAALWPLRFYIRDNPYVSRL